MNLKKTNYDSKIKADLLLELKEKQKADAPYSDTLQRKKKINIDTPDLEKYDFSSLDFNSKKIS